MASKEFVSNALNRFYTNDASVFRWRMYFGFSVPAARSSTGRNLRHLLFLIYINDIPNAGEFLHWSFLLTLRISCFRKDQDELLLQNKILENVPKWLSVKYLSINNNKTPAKAFYKIRAQRLICHTPPLGGVFVWDNWAFYSVNIFLLFFNLLR